jgi:hypothetical protein
MYCKKIVFIKGYILKRNWSEFDKNNFYINKFWFNNKWFFLRKKNSNKFIYMKLFAKGPKSNLKFKINIKKLECTLSPKSLLNFSKFHFFLFLFLSLKYKFWVSKVFLKFDFCIQTSKLKDAFICRGKKVV